MRFDLAAVRQALAAYIAPNATNIAAAGGAALAIFTIGYIAWPGSERAPADAVVVSGPVFTPVAVTPPAPTLAVRKSAPANDNALSETRFNDDVNITRSVQRQLKRAGCYEGPVNGVWNAQTRRGMGEFTRRVNARLPVDSADPVLLVLLETNQEVSCTSGTTSARNDERRAERKDEIAGIADERAAETREAPVRVPEPVRETADAQPRAEDLA
jgi:hypothetical protein